MAPLCSPSTFALCAPLTRPRAPPARHSRTSGEAAEPEDRLAKLRPSTPKYAQTRPNTPKHAQTRPNTPRYTQIRPEREERLPWDVQRVTAVDVDPPVPEGRSPISSKRVTRPPTPVWHHLASPHDPRPPRSNSQTRAPARRRDATRRDATRRDTILSCARASPRKCDNPPRRSMWLHPPEP